MKITTINNISCTGKDKRESRSYLIYPFSQTICAGIGYLIPLKEIDGPDVVAGINSGHKLVMAKTKVPNTVGKWKNAFAGAFIGTALVVIYDILKKINKNN